MQMKIVKSADITEEVDCIFYEDGNFCTPIMILPGYLLEIFYKEYEEVIGKCSKS